jgi:acyl carrier protein
MAIEDEFDVEIPDKSQQTLRTLDEVTDYMAGRLGL